MATADEYAAWIVANPGKRGTPEFATVVQAYELAKADERAAQPAPAAAAVPAPPSVGQRVVGVGEAALTAATGATGGTIGMIALGSEEAQRFYADMGTLYLERLGEMVSAALARVTKSVL